MEKRLIIAGPRMPAYNEKGVVTLAIRYKVDVIAALKAAAFTAYKLEHEQLLHKMSVQKLRQGELVSYSVLGALCKLLKCQPGDLIEHVEDDPKPQEGG